MTKYGVGRRLRYAYRIENDAEFREKRKKASHKAILKANRKANKRCRICNRLCNKNSKLSICKLCYFKGGKK